MVHLGSQELQEMRETLAVKETLVHRDNWAIGVNPVLQGLKGSLELVEM